MEIQAHRQDFQSTYATSRIAEVALFASGILIAFIHLFLRVNATRLVIQPSSEINTQTKPKRPKLRLWGASDLEMSISGPLALQGGRRPDSRQGLIDVGPEKNRFDFEPGYFERSQRPLTPASIRSNGPIDPTKWPLPPDPVQTGFFAEPKDGTTGLHRRNKSNYSLFPTRAEEVPRLPPTVYSPPKSAGGDGKFSKLALRRQSRQNSFADTKSVTDVSEAFSFLVKPPSLFPSRHYRNQSTDSSATVQIGLRFSVAPATLAAATFTKAERGDSPPPVPPLRRDASDESVETLGLPIQSPSTANTPLSPGGELLQPVAFPAPPKPVLSPAKPSPGKTAAFPILSPATYLQDQREKILPPTPRSAVPGPPPTSQPPMPQKSAPGLSGLRMNPISPSSTLSPTSPATPSLSSRSNSLRSGTSPSPTARIPLGAGTMARSPPANGWI